jgi:sugar phosphate isomerase/epimerase
VAPSPSPPILSMDFGFSTFFFMQQSLRDAVEKVLATGLKVIELTHDLPHLAQIDGAFMTYLETLRNQGVRFSLHGPLFEVNLGSVFPGVRSLSRQRMLDAVDMAHKAHCDPLVIHPGYSLLVGKARNIVEEAREYFLTDLAEVVEYAGVRGVRTVLENVHMPYFFLYDTSDFQAIASKVPGIGMALDVGHAYITKRQMGDRDPEGSILEDVQRLGIENVRHVHIHNNFGLKDDHLLTEGAIDLKRVLLGLKAFGYNGKVIVESYDMTGASPRSIAERILGLVVGE